MGIAVDFLIKHVRPIGMDAYEMITTPGPGTLTQWLLDAGVSQQQIDVAYSQWATTADLTISAANLPQFGQSALLISQARWAELYPTGLSTILFLNEPLLKELSYVSEKSAGQNFAFEPAEVIPLAVTIQRTGNQVSINQNVNGANLAADINGNCVHFASLIS
jgi:hypothetical protein